MSYFIRAIEPSDHPFLWELLYQALYVPPTAAPLPREIIYQPKLAKYVQDWGRHGDMGCIAVFEANKALVGAAWLRLLKFEHRGYGYIDDEMPELAVAVLPKDRGQGIGTKLLIHLFEQAKRGYSNISLSVSVDNPALRLYRRLGFEVVEHDDNSLTMKRILVKGLSGCLRSSAVPIQRAGLFQPHIVFPMP